jgi:cell division protein FtsB
VNALVFPFAVICSLGLAGVGLSVLALYQTQSVARVLERRVRARHAGLEAALQSTHQSLDGLAADIRDLQQQPAVAAMPALPRAGLNLSTRRQALRMHRRGDAPAQIAAALEVPLQEIELLLKVHRIVLENLIVNAKPGSTGAA